jgi:cytochrome b subunit of formate dehydrogenase
MATETPDAPVVRNNRRTRWFHAAVALVTLVLLWTGWWLRLGHEGDPTALAWLLGTADTDLHRNAGWALIVVTGLGIIVGVRATVTFVRETARVDRGDGTWFWQWPRGALRGRFARHEGHFDPGQRLANVAFVVTLAALIVSGVILTTLHGGSAFVFWARVHRIATYALSILIAGHVLVAIGVLPGYRGAWRAMHFGGRTSAATARRLWPASVREPRRR